VTVTRVEFEGAFLWRCQGWPAVRARTGFSQFSNVKQRRPLYWQKTIDKIFKRL